MYNRILISTDGSELGQKGVEHGLMLAKGLGLPVTLVTVSEPFPVYSSGEGYAFTWSSDTLHNYSDQQEKASAAILDRAIQTARQHGVEASSVHVSNSQVAEGIISCAIEQNCGLIVMSSHGRRGLNRLVLGSKASEVLSHSNIPVLVVR